MSVSEPKRDIIIRDVASIDDLRKIGAVEKQVWTLDERDLAPMTLLIALKEAGSIIVGAFDGDALVGFALGFPSLESGHVAIHSHMLAVLPEYRDFNLGYRLKLAQRDRALAAGIKKMSWTFDPLQSRNAHFNFAKLGVVSDRYKVDFYGRDSSSVLHQNGTDRLWLTWPLDSVRVQRRLSSARNDALPIGVDAVAADTELRPVRGPLAEIVPQPAALISIPDDIVALENRDPALAWEWRLATRWAFTELLAAGFFVADFFRGANRTGKYMLRRGDMYEFGST